MTMQRSNNHRAAREFKSTRRGLIILALSTSTLLIPACKKAASPSPAKTTTANKEESIRETDVAAIHAPSFSNAANLNSILDQWDKGDQSQLVRQFIDLVQSDPSKDRLHIYLLTEQDFEQLGEVQRETLGDRMLKQVRRYKLLSKATIAAGTTALKSGDKQLATRHFDAVERCAKINRLPPTTDLVSMVAQAIENASRKAREPQPNG